ncbi:MAG: sigma-70 family RNA polymerase sigma factor [Chloroflexi bacterium]|nr:sigma-70 family RNA polymerase sigma factor [Chloroflexota bacterium]
MPDHARLEQYLWENRERFYRIAYSYVRNEADALDIVSEAVVKALQKGDRLQDKAAMATWCYRILTNTAVDYLRKHKRVVYMEDVQQADPGRPDRYHDADLLEALGRLPDNLRMVLVLHYLEEMTIRETASVLGQNENTVKSRLYRALELLRKDLADRSVTPEGGTVRG